MAPILSKLADPTRPGKTQLTARQKEARAMELRMTGAKYKQIAEAVGYRSEASAYKAVKRAMLRTIQEPADELRKLEVERLDQMLMALWRDAMNGKWLAIDRCLKIMERRAVMLGLDAPQRRVVDVITHDAFAEAMEELNKEIAQLETAGGDQKGANHLRKEQQKLLERASS